MADYKIVYACLMGEIDEALSIMDTDNLLEFYRAKDILEWAMERAEEMFVGDEGY